MARLANQLGVVCFIYYTDLGMDDPVAQAMGLNGGIPTGESCHHKFTPPLIAGPVLTCFSTMD